MRRSIRTAKLQSIGAIILLLFIFLSAWVFSANSESSSVSEIHRQSIMSVLTVPRRESISVNAAKAISGATILSGATITTPDQVGATIDVASLATLDIAPNTTLKAEFDRNGNVKVTLTQGCMRRRGRQGTTVEIVTPG